MTILTRFSGVVLIRASAIASILIGLMYMPAVFKFYGSVMGLGLESYGILAITEWWGTYAVGGGVGILLGSFLANKLGVSNTARRISLAAALISMFLLIVAQLPPLFWWMFVATAVFSWPSALGCSLHFFLLLFALWGAIAIIYSIEREIL
ncbi:hypothetical protein BEP19_02275 [Ammoniphilus oxalaticus]|uniref:Major facilitator superfamily (MFS) profile domain-containing protein n=1 Tax=Ammoniphilus oxalaticus TaxID=66863 RepID=A0A419SNE3_9BACL|nr:hypothetical protein [Ammoniphilus oxalaticus]RKD25787.1 hypothetical protein BEP19_02275 [Ammoniphilus oxalaticus]